MSNEMKTTSDVFNRLADYAEDLENEVEILDAIVENLEKVVENMREEHINLKMLVHDYCVCLDDAAEKELFDKLCEFVSVSTSEIE